MKMIWSWWPDIGFEPRYGGDVAAGFFTMAWYLKGLEDLKIADVALADLEQAVMNSYLADEHMKFLNSIQIENENTHREFQEGWYSVASSMAKNSVERIESTMERISLESEAGRNEDALAEIHEEVQLLQDKVDNLQEENTLLQARLDKTKNEIESLDEDAAALRSSLERTASLLETLENVLIMVGAVSVALFLIYLIKVRKRTVPFTV